MSTIPSPDEGGQVVPFPFTPPPIKDGVEPAYIFPPQERIDAIDALPDGQERVWQGARLLAEYGFAVCPIVGNTKGVLLDDLNPAFHASSDVEKIDKWLKPGTGRFAKAGKAPVNIKLRPGVKSVNSNPFSAGTVDVLDLDVIDCDLGSRLLADLVGAARETTPSNGMHIFIEPIQHPRKLITKTRAPRLSKSGDGTTDIVHVAELFTGNGVVPPNHTPLVWPSVIKGVRYQLYSGPLGKLPDWVYEEFGITESPVERTQPVGQRNVGRGNEFMEERVTLPKLTGVLNKVDPDLLSYDEWIKTGFVVAKYYPDDIGLETWHKWSERGSSHQPDECAKRWEGILNSPPPSGESVTIATLHMYANNTARGLEPSHRAVGNGGDAAALVEALNQEFTMLDGGKSVSYIVRRADSNTFGVYGRQHFHELCQNRKRENAGLVVGGKKIVTDDEIWCAHKDRAVVHALELNPSLPYFHKRPVPGIGVALNTFTGWPVAPIEGDCTPFLEFMFEIIAAGDDALYSWDLNWLAHCFQCPTIKPGTAPVLISPEEGVGKGFFAGAIARLYGNYSYAAKADDLKNRFNPYLSNHLYIFGDEMQITRQATERLMVYITEPKLAIERKGENQYDMISFHRFVLASNHEAPLYTGPYSRRFATRYVSNKRQQDYAYFGRLDDWLKSGGINHLMHYLLTVPTNERLAHSVPMTTALATSRQINTCSSYKFLWHVVDEHDICFTLHPETNVPYITRKNLYAQYRAWFEGNEPKPHQHLITSDAFGSRLKLCGFKDGPRLRDTDTDARPRTYIVPTRGELIAQLRKVSGYMPEDITNADDEW